MSNGPFEPPPDPPGFTGPFIPAGMPPGTEYGTSSERAPEGVTYFRIYAVLQALTSAAVALLGLAMMLAPLATRPKAGGRPDWEALAAGVFYALGGAAFFVPTLIALFAGRRPWAHTLGTVVIAMGMLNMCCIPILIPVLIVWMKPETRRWYGAG